ncbi:UBX domain-containing protein 8-like [Physella acuta]|uniref:UBX domain-containing protein 8-like n=1 Tax=Physella acuta TaxID=109671 RepID=UPI0027DBD800|nr:UBX domain-containing protein 8-like [Physella acuta]XP_059167507.1 UBX domain-containing protein 8-like [Physella acuta]XP_059167508.1 UBX domain-containing protein 8-like [Physella acuta]XP_059167509.1 UBX domain-containing protein 8-like [Physella acuta]
MIDTKDIRNFIYIACQGFFLTAVVALFLNWLVTKFIKFHSARRTEGKQREITSSYTEQCKTQESDWKQQLQRQYETQAESYKERVLLPREESKRKKKEEEFLKFSGPSWKGQGHALGGESVLSAAPEGPSASAGQTAAQHRRVLEDINQQVADAAAHAAAVARRPKKVITLPEEPDSNDADTITIIFRTPIGTICQRRFNASDQVQVLLDFITVEGFSQRTYTVATSYPRRVLQDPQACLRDFKFQKKVVLNIEERD